MKKIVLLLVALFIVGGIQARDQLTLCVAGCQATRNSEEQACYWGTLPWEQELYRSCMAGAASNYQQCFDACYSQYE